jgi:hypothetical protein
VALLGTRRQRTLRNVLDPKLHRLSWVTTFRRHTSHEVGTDIQRNCGCVKHNSTLASLPLQQDRRPDRSPARSCRLHSSCWAVFFKWRRKKVFGLSANDDDTIPATSAFDSLSTAPRMTCMSPAFCRANRYLETCLYEAHHGPKSATTNGFVAPKLIGQTIFQLRLGPTRRERSSRTE